MSEFSAMMVKFCPATCGLCLTKRCKDQIDDCEDMKSLCTNGEYFNFIYLYWSTYRFVRGFRDIGLEKIY